MVRLEEVVRQQPDDIKKALMVRSDERAGIEGVRALTEPLLDNFKAAGKTVCKLTPEGTKSFASKVKPVWDVFAEEGAGQQGDPRRGAGREE